MRSRGVNPALCVFDAYYQAIFEVIKKTGENEMINGLILFAVSAVALFGSIFYLLKGIDIDSSKVD